MDHLSPTSLRRAPSFETFHLEPLSRALTIANDGYDYTDAGVAPEDAPTTGGQGRQAEGIEPTIRAPRPIAPPYREPDDTLRLWTRWIDGAWRPKLPDEESAAGGPLQITPGDTANTARKTMDLEIMHNWTQKMEHDESLFYLNVVRRPATNAQNAAGMRKTPIEGHIRWIHSEETRMAHAKFEDLFSRYVSKHVDSGVKDLTRRLLKRVWATDERDFIGGKFLIPGATRYDGQSKNADEKPCTFFNFPYFSVERPHTGTQPRGQPASGNLEHPVRTLLQSRYRLEATDARDRDQSITKLTRREVNTCIRPSSNYAGQNVHHHKSKPIIHVPQLWCLSLSGDVIVTSGCISETNLRGSSVMTRETNVQMPQPGRGPPLVRILLEHSGKQQPFLYPTDQCDWWFGLLNKQRQILRSLGDGSDTEVKFGEYKFYTVSEASGERLVDIHNWHDTLKKEKSEKLDLWIRRAVPDVTVTEDASDGVTNVGGTTDHPDPQNSEADSSAATLEASVTQSNPAVSSVAQPTLTSASTLGGTITASPSEDAGDRPNTSYVLSEAAIQPFFEWPFLDDEGKLDKHLPEDKAKAWLKRIHTTLQVKFGTLIEEVHARGVEPAEALSAQATANTRQRKIHLCSYADACARLRRPETGQSRHITDMKRLCVEAELLFQLFVPVKSQPASYRGNASHRSSASQSHTSQPPLEGNGAKKDLDSGAIGLYWGVVDALILCLSNHEDPQVDIAELLRGLQQITSAAKEIHLGMRSLRSLYADRQDSPNHGGDTDVKLLLEVIVDAFEVVFHVLFGAVQYFWNQAATPDNNRSRISDFINNHVDECCRLLVVAKARLIVEADEINHDKEFGPVVTPEAIIIMLLERLSHGVYHNATIDVLDLYEKIVEKIALKVEKSASRRLLLEINRVSEELDIINDVLRQQKSVLTPFRESLDPATFKVPSIPRKMKFQYESKSIDRILKALQESIIDCAELRERASRLAIQNVQLVETQLEDNSKAIIVFTVVTIFFLPLSFVTGFFGMNLEGIIGTTSTVKHFWAIALPLTFGVVFTCLFAAFLGSIKRWIQRQAKRRKEKNA